MSDAPAIAMATGMPVTISARKDVRSVPVMAESLATSWRSFDRLLDRVLRPLEQAEAAAPVLDAHLDRPDRRGGEPQPADAVDDVHRQVDDGHLEIAHFRHHLDREAPGG